MNGEPQGGDPAGPAATRLRQLRATHGLSQEQLARLLGVSFATVPVLSVSLDPGESVVAEAGEFSWMTDSVQMSTGMGGGVGGPGLMGALTKKIGGEGRAWVELAGEVIRYEPAGGQSLPVHPGHVGMFDASVAFQVMRVQGVANRYFGGDTHHFAVLSRPGTVWLQSMPLPLFAASLAPYLSAPDNRHAAVEGGVIGGVVNDLLR